MISKRFGKVNKVFLAEGVTGNNRMFSTSYHSTHETIHEQDVIKSTDFNRFKKCEFAGILADSNKTTFRVNFNCIQLSIQVEVEAPIHSSSDVISFYSKTRDDINQLLGI